jgi:hypothetical protein
MKNKSVPSYPCIKIVCSGLYPIGFILLINLYSKSSDISIKNYELLSRSLKITIETSIYIEGGRDLTNCIHSFY